MIITRLFKTESYCNTFTFFTTFIHLLHQSIKKYIKMLTFVIQVIHSIKWDKMYKKIVKKIFHMLNWNKWHFYLEQTNEGFKVKKNIFFLIIQIMKNSCTTTCIWIWILYGNVFNSKDLLLNTFMRSHGFYLRLDKWNVFQNCHIWDTIADFG